LSVDVGWAKRWFYLAIVLELYSRKIVGWSMASAMPAALVCPVGAHSKSANGAPK